jgi:hypothetical protein
VAHVDRFDNTSVHKDKSAVFKCVALHFMAPRLGFKPRSAGETARLAQGRRRLGWGAISSPVGRGTKEFFDQSRGAVVLDRAARGIGKAHRKCPEVTDVHVLAVALGKE